MMQVFNRMMLYTAGVLGMLAGIVPMFFSYDMLLSTMPVAMMFSIYFLVPKIQKERRLVSAIIVSLLAAVISFAVYFLYDLAASGTTVAGQHFVTTLTNLAMSIVIISLFGSWLFVWVHNFTERKRAELDAKVAARKQERKAQMRSGGGTKKKYKKKKK
jgi:hypothetical protein